MTDESLNTNTFDNLDSDSGGPASSGDSLAESAARDGELKTLKATGPQALANYVRNVKLRLASQASQIIKEADTK